VLLALGMSLVETASHGRMPISIRLDGCCSFCCAGRALTM